MFFRVHCGAASCSQLCSYTRTHKHHIQPIPWTALCTAQGNVANFVESEQLVSLDNGALLASYVQV